MATITATNPLTASPLDAPLFARRPEGADDGARFASVLGRHTAGSGETPEQLARRSAESFVAIALVQPILKQLRETSRAAPPFAPTQGQKQFQALADAELAQRMVKRAHFPLVDRLTSDMLKRAAGRDANAAPANPDNAATTPARPAGRRAPEVTP